MTLRVHPGTGWSVNAAGITHVAFQGDPGRFCHKATGEAVTSWRIIEGDCRDVLATLDAGSVQTCVTSPPYFGLRDYGHDAQIGREPTPAEFVNALVRVFADVRRVLTPTGTLWVNLGDKFWDRATHAGIQRKELVGVPWMLAFALRADGWLLRDEIIWGKKQAMPDPVRDRTTRAHEHIFMLTKGPSYYYDADAAAEDAVSEHPSGNGYARDERLSYTNADGTPRGASEGWTNIGGKRNRRSVWMLANEPSAVKHFAVMPTKAAEPCILAGCPERVCEACSAPWIAEDGPLALDVERPQARRAVELAQQHGLTDAHFDAIRAAGISDTGKALVTTAGAGKSSADVQALADEAKDALGGYYREFLLVRPTRGALAPTCDCGVGHRPGIVLDPFAGAGTTGLVALRHNRSFIGCELNPAYAEIARNRIRDDAPLMNSIAEAA